MKRLITAISIGAALVLVNAAPAMAHDNGRNIYNQHYQYRTVNVRNRGIPSWLRHKRSFRSWYRHSALSTNRYLTWSELYQIYRWERSYPNRRYKRSHAYSGHHHYGWYRSYWKKQHNRYIRKRTKKHRDWDRRH